MKKIIVVFYLLFSFVSLGQNKDAEQFIDSITIAYNKLTSVEEKKKELIKITGIQNYHHEIGDFILQKSQELSFEKGISLGYLKYGVSYNLKAKFSKSLNELNKVNPEDLSHIYLQTYHFYSYTNLYRLGNYDRALIYLASLDSLVNKYDSKNHLKLANIKQEYGLTYLLLFQYTNNKAYFKKGIDYYEKSISQTDKDTIKANKEVILSFTSKVYYLMAKAYYSDNEYQKAHLYILKSLSFFEIKNKETTWDLLSKDRYISNNITSKLMLLDILCSMKDSVGVKQSIIEIDSLFNIIQHEKIKNILTNKIILSKSFVYSFIKEYNLAMKFYLKSINITSGLNKATMAWNYIDSYNKSIEVNKTRDSVHELMYTTLENLISSNVGNKITESVVKYETLEKEKEILSLNSEVQKLEIDKLKNRNYALLAGLGILLIAGVFVYIFKRKQNKNKKEVDKLNKQALQLQMNPHFFFNSLNSINSYITNNDKKEAKYFLTKFARLMRLTLENSQEEMITLEKEFEFLDNYLALEQIRKKNYEYIIDLPESIKELKIPAMLIQPLLENSIIHAFNNMNGKGTISLIAKKENDMISILVSDDGEGISNTQEVLVPGNHKSMALKILNKRIKLLTKDFGSLTYQNSNENKGTEIKIVLPVFS